MIGPENHANVKLESNGFLRNENLQQKQKRTAKSPNLKESAGKINIGFVIRIAMQAEKLGCCLGYYRSTIGKLAFAVNTRGHLIRVSDGRNLCPLWLVILKSD